MAMKLLVEIGKDQIDLYLSHPKGRGNTYVKYRLAHLVKPFTDGGTRQNQDLWRLYEAYVYEKTADGMEQTLPYPIVSRGEWEAAIQVKDTPDFHGGYHGYELLTRVEATVDGTLISLDAPQFIWGTECTFLQESDLICQGTRDEVLARHIKRYRFAEGQLRLEQEVHWEKAVPVTKAFMAMLPIRRTADSTDAGIQITDWVTVNGESPAYDVSKIGHQTPISAGTGSEKDFHYAEIWGESSKLFARMSVEGDFPASRSFMVQNTPAYNKLYFAYARDHQTAVGEKWKITTKYEIYQKNNKE